MNRFFIDEDITVAKTIHKDFYTDMMVFEMLKDAIFSSSWQYVASSEKLSIEGDVLPFLFIEKYIEEPLILVKGKDKCIRCLSNVCTHRGNLLAYEKCNAPNGIVCKYHGRRFELDGKFAFMPEFKEVKNFPSEDDHLKTLPLHQWANFLFTSLRPKFDADLLLKPIKDRLSWLPLSVFALRPELGKDYFVHSNWALYCENYLEGFHIPFVHEGLNAAIDYSTYETIIEDKCILQIGYSKDDTECFELPASSVDYGKNVAAYYYWVYPNMMFNFYPWGLSINIVKPISIDETKVSFIVYMWDESKYNHGAGSDLDKVEMEDEEVVQNVQKGIRSSFYNHGRYSAKREIGTHHFHLLMSQALSNDE